MERSNRGNGCIFDDPAIHCRCVVTIHLEECPMTWMTPTLVEICIGLEINGYLPAEF
jgi:coenzyme PQQ precursor peptide PqqA